MHETPETDGEFRKRSAWLFPLAVVSIVFLLSAGVLLFYFSPDGPDLFQEQVSPTSSQTIVTLSIQGQTFFIPANYLLYEHARKGGPQREVAMFARLPHLVGWSNWQAEDFADASADSKILYATLRADRNNLSEADRLKRVYGDYVDRNPHPGPYDLVRYDYKSQAGYGDEDFYVGQTDRGPAIFRCVRQSQIVPAPNCLRDQYIARGVSLTWRFKRAQLAHWRRMDDALAHWVAALRTKPK